jgi:hypothetical protein
MTRRYLVEYLDKEDWEYADCNNCGRNIYITQYLIRDCGHDVCFLCLDEECRQCKWISKHKDNITNLLEKIKK